MPDPQAPLSLLGLNATTRYRVVPLSDDGTLTGTKEGHSTSDDKFPEPLTFWGRIARNGNAVAAWSAVVVFVINGVFLIVAVALGDQRREHDKASSIFNLGEGMTLLNDGECDAIANGSVSIHITINILSAILLAASNYTMQLLSAPSREDLDKAHQKGKSLDIGCQSFRNLWHIPRSRGLLWSVLAISSLPIHLLYNSAVTKLLEANGYSYAIEYSSSSVAVPSGFENITAADCRQAYETDFVLGHGDVIIVTNSSIEGAPAQTPFTPVPAMVRSDPVQNAIPYALYCFAKSMPKRCALLVSIPVLAIVALCNAVKAAAMFITLRTQRKSTLVTLGDAIQSFLDEPDPVTRGRCLLSREESRGFWFQSPKVNVTTPVREPLQFSATLRDSASRRWRSVPSSTLWFMNILLFIAGAILFTVFMLSAGSTATGGSDGAWSGWLSNGFGQPSAHISRPSGLPDSDSGSSLIISALLVNTPQLLFSMIYLLYNSLFTQMLAAHEYHSFATGLQSPKKSLRVSRPSKGQRPMYYLQVPYKYAVPMVLTSAVLHWLISQSLFLVQTKGASTDNQMVRDPLIAGSSNQPSSGLMGVEFSPRAVVSTIGLFLAMLVVLLCFGQRRLPGDMPVAGSCSLAISAASHRHPDDPDAAHLPLQWGEPASIQDNEKEGHCCFTSLPVRPLIPGRLYQ